MIFNGGLGNQLFQYFAGQYLAYKSGGVLRIDPSLSQFGKSGHPDWLSEVTFPRGVMPSVKQYSLRNFYLSLKRHARDFVTKTVSNRDLRLRLLNQYQSPTVGYDPQLELIRPPVTVVGFFQTWKYYQALSDEGLTPNLSVKNPSDWFLEKVKEIDRHGNILGLHVRRGDYVGNLDIGTLAVSYYETALKELARRGVTWDAIWVFSDDALLAQSEFSKLGDLAEQVHFINPPRESHSFESLMLMSKCSSLVIANSTFSWWAATLGNPDKVTVCPSKWFVKMDDPQDLYPRSWIRVPSEWTNPKSP
jgi:hypothetical protein